MRILKNAAYLLGLILALSFAISKGEKRRFLKKLKLSLNL